jgi:hypothetical protein
MPATWFRNATTVSDFTTRAVPSILTGSDPDIGREEHLSADELR